MGYGGQTKPVFHKKVIYYHFYLAIAKKIKTIKLSRLKLLRKLP